MKLISVVTACYNEEENIEEIYSRVKAIFFTQKNYCYEHIFIDNASTDNTVKILKSLAEHDKNLKIIVNARNFGHIRSPFYGLLQAKGEAVISIVADLQDPPELIPEFIKKWEFPMSAIRHAYYNFVSKISDTKLIKNFTGFGLYDQSFIEILRGIDDTYPYFRGLISEIGFPTAEIPYQQPLRKHGKSKNRFYSLYDMAILGITTHSKLPIRLATMGGFFLSLTSAAAAIIFFTLKLIFWNQFPMGIAPILIGIFFFASVQLFFIGILGEYVLSIHTQVLKRPLVIEHERINFGKSI